MAAESARGTSRADVEAVSRSSLFRRVFATNAAILAAACAITVLVLAPGADPSGVALTELAILAGGLGAMLVLDLYLIRRAFAPLRRLAAFARVIDPLRPGARVPSEGSAEVAGLAVAFNEMLDRLEQERRDSVRRALDAQEGERLRVAQELHDEVGQTLTSVVLQLGRTSKRVPGEYRPELVEAQETARSSLEEVRRIAQQLRPEALDDLGLASALHVFAERSTEDGGLRVGVEVDEPLPPLSSVEELVVYRVAQEALTNVIRHARAGRAELRFHAAGGRLELTVDDDGEGLGGAPDGGGIRGMRERAVLADAELSLEPSPLGGVRVRLVLASADGPRR